MAAHVLRALKELRDDDCTVKQFRHGLSYAPFGDNLEWKDWNALSCEDNDERFKKLAIAMIPPYELTWCRLGEPATAEEWLERKNAI